MDREDISQAASNAALFCIFILFFFYPGVPNKPYYFNN